MNIPRIEIDLPKDVSKKIAEFWKIHGGESQAMISQPVFYGNGYRLRIRMLSIPETERLQNSFDKILVK